MSNAVFEIVTERLIKQIEQRTCPWRKPWNGGNSPQNLITGRAYSGFNRLACSGFEKPFFATFKQVSENGMRIKKGSKALPIVFWTKYENEDSEKTFMAPRFYKVFNVSDIESCAELDSLLANRNSENDNAPRLDADKVISETGAMIEYGNGSAYYIPSKDRIEMPAIGQFKDSNSFYGTAFHELGHWTGAKSRLNREGIADMHAFGSERYSKEELIAELTSSFVCDSLGIDGNIETSASYLASWLKVIKAEPKMLLTSASAAQKAANFIMKIEVNI